MGGAARNLRVRGAITLDGYMPSPAILVLGHVPETMGKDWIRVSQPRGPNSNRHRQRTAEKVGKGS
jgi:hypothetical protein